MNHLCCPSCRLRFDRAAAAHLTTCPECSRRLILLADRSSLIGFRLFDALDDPHTMPEAIAVAIPIPGFTDDRR
jgi:hypothetical protein